MIGEKTERYEVVLEFIPLIAVKSARIRPVKKEKSCYHHFGNKNPFNISPKEWPSLRRWAKKKNVKVLLKMKKGWTTSLFSFYTN